MEKCLMQLGFSHKEAEAYLALLEFGSQPASVIAKKTNMPRPTVLFLFDGLVKRGYVRRSQRGRVQYFYVDPNDLKKAKVDELQEEEEALKKVIPLLEEFKNPYTSPPKITFFEGLEGCRKAYSMLLDSETAILEFAAHEDLERMGKDFMKNFVEQRTTRKRFIRPICIRSPLNKAFHAIDKKQQRNLKMFSSKKFGIIYSSIDIFEDKVLLLNLRDDAFAILMQSKAVADTLRTIHSLAWVGAR